MVADYLALCRHPLKDLKRWLAEDKKKAGGIGRRYQSTATKERNHACNATQTQLADAHGLRRQSLPDVRVRLDADGQGGRNGDCVFARSRAGIGRYDELRQVREERTGLASHRANDAAFAPDTSLQGMRAVILALYGAKIELTRRSLPASEVSAAVRAILAEQSAAFRELAGRRFAAMRAARERRQALHYAEGENSKIERAGGPDARPL